MLQDIFDFLYNLLLWLPRKAYELIADGIDGFLSLIPNDSINVQQALNGWGGDVLYFMGVFEVDYGLTAIFSALVARFLLRRIPFIG